MKKTVAILSILIIIGIPVGFYIHHRMEISNFNEKLQQALGKDQGLIETILKVESESGSMSYEELFEMCDKSVSERTNIVVELRGLYPNLESKLKDSLIEFLTDENELVRAKSQTYRKLLHISSTYDNLKDYMSNYSYNVFTINYFISSANRYKKEIKEGTYDMLRDIIILQTNYEKLILKEKNMALLMKKEDLRFIPLFEKYKTSNHDFAQKSIDYCNAVQKNCENSSY